MILVRMMEQIIIFDLLVNDFCLQLFVRSFFVSSSCFIIWLLFLLPRFVSPFRYDYNDVLYATILNSKQYNDDDDDAL